MSDKLCGNCTNKCVRLHAMWCDVAECTDWQPIPVATTDAPTSRLRSWESDSEVMYLREAIAKRD